MNKRRFTAMLLAALMTASVITSCVEDDTAEDENKQPAVTTTDASAKDPAGDNPNSNSGTHLDPSVDMLLPFYCFGQILSRLHIILRLRIFLS